MGVEWTAVAVAVRDESQREPAHKLFTRLQHAGFFSASTQILVIVDATEHNGSAGTALNALLITAEHLCAQRGHAVLNDAVVRDASILVLLTGEPCSDAPLGKAFLPDWREKEEGEGTRRKRRRGEHDEKDHHTHLPPLPVISHIQCLQDILPDDFRGVWVLSTEAVWTLSSTTKIIDPIRDGPTAFCYRTTHELALQHGTYTVDDKGFVNSLAYRTCASADPLLILGLLYLPPAAATQFLTLAWTYPLSRATYHGEDSGCIGLKLSLFFDIVHATCSDLQDFLHSTIAPAKIECANKDILRQARSLIHRHFGRMKTRAVVLEVDSYSYMGCGGVSACPFTPSREEAEDFVERLLGEFRSWLLNGLEVALKSTSPVLPYLRALKAFESDATTRETMRLCQRLMQPQSDVDVSRCLATVGECLWLSAEGRGGIRAGPAANPHFAPAIAQLKDSATLSAGLHGLFDALPRWMDTPSRMVRAARHMEAASQVFTQRRVMNICQKLRWEKESMLPTNAPSSVAKDRPVSVSVRLPARIDLFGGWLDTPPITLDAPSAGVLNMAVTIDGKLPLGCSVALIERPLLRVIICEETVELSPEEALNRHDRPSMQGALICACIVGCGLADDRGEGQEGKALFVEDEDSWLTRGLRAHGIKAPFSGLQVQMHSDLAHGSGLGSSSILAAACVSALWRLLGVPFDSEDIVHRVLYIEQLLTTGGGWQDQVGGVYPGMKLGVFDPVLQRVSVKQIPLSPSLEQAISDRLCLVYTGQPRLAKNLLQEVVRDWLLREGDKCQALQGMSEEIARSSEWIRTDSLPVEHIARYYEAKKRLATGCEPEAVTSIREKLSCVSAASWLVGAGGGGYLAVLLNEGHSRDEAERILHSRGHSDLRLQRAQLYTGSGETTIQQYLGSE